MSYIGMLLARETSIYQYMEIRQRAITKDVDHGD